MSLREANIIDDGNAIGLTWSDGTAARFHAVWLRDNALAPETGSQANGQRLKTVLDIPRDLIIKQAAIQDDGTLSVNFGPDGHTTDFPEHWLRRKTYHRSADQNRVWTNQDVTLWDYGLQGSVPTANYAAVAVDQHILTEWLRVVEQFGYADNDGLISTHKSLEAQLQETAA